jgi:uncharacterized glyoxalase superfamily protein PhnB
MAVPPSTPPTEHPGLIVPVLRYRDAKAMIDWLCKFFGFEQQAVYEDEQGRVLHAQLTYGAQLGAGDAVFPAYGAARRGGGPRNHEHLRRRP